GYLPRPRGRKVISGRPSTAFGAVPGQAAAEGPSAAVAGGRGVHRQYAALGVAPGDLETPAGGEGEPAVPAQLLGWRAPAHQQADNQRRRAGKPSVSGSQMRAPMARSGLRESAGHPAASVKANGRGTSSHGGHAPSAVSASSRQGCERSG